MRKPVTLGPRTYRAGGGFLLGIFSIVAIGQFWSLANDVLTQGEGKRLFPLVAVGETLGGIVGSQIAARTIDTLSVYQLMSIAGGILSCCVLPTHAGRRAALEHRARAADGGALPERDPRGGFTLLLGDRYLLLIGVSVLLLNLINTTGDYVLAEMVNQQASAVASGSPDPQRVQEQTIAQFYGDFQTAVTTLTALIQIALVARLFNKIGVSPSLLLLPIFVFAGYGLCALIPTLALLATVKITENGTDYSLQNTLQQALFLPTSRDAKYKAKAAIDTFVVRAGDLASAGVVALGVQLGVGPRTFAAANAGLGLIWVGVAWRIGRRHGRLVRDVSAPPTRNVGELGGRRLLRWRAGS